MQKNILITGSTDGLGLETARMLVAAGHHVLLHGRNREKLQNVAETLDGLSGDGRVEQYVANLSSLSDVVALVRAVTERHDTLDVLINNAGVFGASDTVTADGLDIRFAVNTIAPWLLTQRLLPLLGASGRVINLSSAAQSPVDPAALRGEKRLSDQAAYAQSKLALTMWSRALALSADGAVVVAVNPGSMLGSKMVKEAFGVEGADIGIGAEILVRAALSDEFESASGKYFDNDAGRFASPHPDALDARKSDEVVRIIESIVIDVT